MCAAKGVWVLIEQQEERLRDGCLEVVGEGRKIADKLGDELTAVITGSISDEQINLLAQHGASRILSVEHPALNPYSVEIHAQILAEVIKQHTPDVVLAIDSINGADIACRVAARLGSVSVSIVSRAVGPKLYHAGMKAKLSRNTLAKANELRNWKIYRDIALILIDQARTLYARQPLARNFKRAIYITSCYYSTYNGTVVVYNTL